MGIAFRNAGNNRLRRRLARIFTTAVLAAGLVTVGSVGTAGAHNDGTWHPTHWGTFARCVSDFYGGPRVEVFADTYVEAWPNAGIHRIDHTNGHRFTPVEPLYWTTGVYWYDQGWRWYSPPSIRNAGGQAPGGQLWEEYRDGGWWFLDGHYNAFSPSASDMRAGASFGIQLRKGVKYYVYSVLQWGSGQPHYQSLGTCQL